MINVNLGRGLIATFVSSSFVSSLPQIAIQKERINQNVYLYYYYTCRPIITIVSCQGKMQYLKKKFTLSKTRPTRVITIFPP